MENQMWNVDTGDGDIKDRAPAQQLSEQLIINLLCCNNIEIDPHTQQTTVTAGMKI